MKHSDDYRIRLFLVVFVAAIVLGSGSAKADFIFTEPVNLGNTSDDEEGPCISADGLTLYFIRRYQNSNYQLMASRRPHTNFPWSWGGAVEMPLRPDYFFSDPSISTDGLSMYLTKHGTGIIVEIWGSQRPDIYSAWNEPVKLSEAVNASSYAGGPCISADNLELYFVMNALPSRDSQLIVSDSKKNIWITKRTSEDEPWGTPELVLQTSGSIYNPCISSDGQTLIFSQGMSSLYMARRTGTESHSFEDPIKLPDPVNYENDPVLSINTHPCLSHDGKTLYFVCNRPTGSRGSDLDIWTTTSVTVVDFNGDENIDTNDLLILMDNWNTSEPLCDIAPAPWGDNMVDIKDLEVFIEYWEKEKFPVLPDECMYVYGDNFDPVVQVTLEQRQGLVVTFKWHPTSGYQWELVENTDSIMAQQGEAEFISSSPGGTMIGIGGWEVFRFKAVSAGQETLNLVYRRPGENDPIMTFSIEVTVN